MLHDDEQMTTPRRGIMLHDDEQMTTPRRGIMLQI